jgi:zinc transporter ZupT
MEMKIIFICDTLLLMNIAIGLAALTAIATTAGGFLAIKSKDRLHLVLGLSAGLLLGLVAFDLLPEVFELGTQEIFHAPAVSVALIGGFLLLHFYEQLFGSHEPAESDYGHDHEHSSNIAGALGALAMGGHVFLDGLALGVAFKVSSDLGIAVFIALLVHAFSDGLNTVSFLIKSGKWGRKGIWLLGVDAIARVSGAALGTTLALSNNVIAIYLAVFAGIVIYLATSHILPEAHSRHSSKLTILATILGVLVMWGLVSYLHSGDAHAHGSGTEVHEEVGHHDEEMHEDEAGHHDEEMHEDEAGHHDEEMHDEEEVPAG